MYDCTHRIAIETEGSTTQQLHIVTHHDDTHVDVRFVFINNGVEEIQSSFYCRLSDLQWALRQAESFSDSLKRYEERQPKEGAQG